MRPKNKWRRELEAETNGMERTWKALQEIATDRRAWVGWFRAHVPWRMK